MYLNNIANGKIQNVYAPKPYRTGAWVLIINSLNKEEWIYTANPHLYREGFGNDPLISFPFFKTPEHMQIED